MSTRSAPRMPTAGVDLFSAEGLSEHDVPQVTSLLGRLVEGRPSDPHVDIEEVTVAPAAQGRGVGKGLLTALNRAARECGTEIVTLALRR